MYYEMSDEADFVLHEFFSFSIQQESQIDLSIQQNKFTVFNFGEVA